MVRVGFEEMKNELRRVLLKKGFDKDKADIAAQNFTETSCDGINSHGVNRFIRVVEYIEKGYINVEAVPIKESGTGAFERWNGNLGLGNVNAKICMDRAIELARTYGIGGVALKNTNHWMRGGSYGWQAADAGCIGICWTNTQPNMPAWGAKDRRIGNNPLIFAVPKKEGHVVVDAAMAQFSYGNIESHKLSNKKLPVPGGYDSNGDLSTDPNEIEKTWRVLPIGYWKGSAFSIVMDLIAAVLSGGNTTHRIGMLGGDEYQLSQVFIAIDVEKIAGKEYINSCAEEIIKDIKESEKVNEAENIRYPGESVFRIRNENLAKGIPVNDDIWNKIKAM